VFAGAPLPFKIVFGIDLAVLPAALAGIAVNADAIIAIVKRMDKWFRFTGDLQVLGV
jgi:hypothetical protein